MESSNIPPISSQPLQPSQTPQNKPPSDAEFNQTKGEILDLIHLLNIDTSGKALDTIRDQLQVKMSQFLRLAENDPDTKEGMDQVRKLDDLDQTLSTIKMMIENYSPEKSDKKYVTLLLSHYADAQELANSLKGDVTGLDVGQPFPNQDSPFYFFLPKISELITQIKTDAAALETPITTLSTLAQDWAYSRKHSWGIDGQTQAEEVNVCVKRMLKNLTTLQTIIQTLPYQNFHSPKLVISQINDTGDPIVAMQNALNKLKDVTPSPESPYPEFVYVTAQDWQGTYFEALKRNTIPLLDQFDWAKDQWN